MTHYHVKGWFRSLLALWFLHASPAGARESAASAPTCCLSKRRAKHTTASRSLARTEGNAHTGKGRWEERGLQIGNHLGAHNSDLFVCCHGDWWQINTAVLWGARGVVLTRWHDYNESGLRLNERDKRQKLTKEIRVMATAPAAIGWLHLNCFAEKWKEQYEIISSSASGKTDEGLQPFTVSILVIISCSLYANHRSKKICHQISSA